MVAKTSITDRFMRPPEPFVAGRWWVHKVTYDDAQAMMRLGIIPEDASTELLNALVVLKDRAAAGQDPRIVGIGHTICVERLSELRARISSEARHVRSQQPLVCSETHVPEPDFMVLRGKLADYSDFPAATDAYCIVEVADSSYERDADEKLKGYAQSGVPQYVIINLRNRTAEVYTTPDAAAGTYPPPQIVAENQSLGLRVGEQETFTVTLADVLP